MTGAFLKCRKLFLLLKKIVKLYKFLKFFLKCQKTCAVFCFCAQIGKTSGFDCCLVLTSVYGIPKNFSERVAASVIPSTCPNCVFTVTPSVEMTKKWMMKTKMDMREKQYKKICFEPKLFKYHKTA